MMNTASSRFILFLEEAFLLLLISCLALLFLSVSPTALLLSLQVNHAEVEFRNFDPVARFDYSPGSPNSRVFAQALLCEQAVVLLFESCCLVTVFFCFLKQFEECSLSLVRLLQLSFQFFVELLCCFEVVIE